MATPFSDVYDLFMQNITDYRLVNLYTASVTDFETYLSSWLYSAISDFDGCDQSLANSNASFSENLSQRNMNILVLLMKKYWLQKEVDDIKQINSAVTDRDFKRYAESTNMTAKQNRLVQIQEEISQKLVEYGLKTNDWSSWINSGVFYVP